MLYCKRQLTAVTLWSGAKMGKCPPLDSSRGGPNLVFEYSVEKGEFKKETMSVVYPSEVVERGEERK